MFDGAIRGSSQYLIHSELRIYIVMLLRNVKKIVNELLKNLKENHLNNQKMYVITLKF
jgi:hypothetical protein